MVAGVQKIAKALGLEGCYFLSLGRVAEDVAHITLDPILEADKAIKVKTLGLDCYVQKADAIFNTMVGLGPGTFEVVKAGAGHPLPLDYPLKPGEHEILRFERPNPDDPKNPLAHFVVGAGDGKTVAWDPWPDSLTVAQGHLVSRRIIRRKA